MRYWQHDETGRLLKVDVQMSPSKWTELTKEQYEEICDREQHELDSEPEESS